MSNFFPMSEEAYNEMRDEQFASDDSLSEYYAGEYYKCSICGAGGWGDSPCDEKTHVFCEEHNAFDCKTHDLSALRFFRDYDIEIVVDSQSQFGMFQLRLKRSVPMGQGMRELRTKLYTVMVPPMSGRALFFMAREEAYKMMKLNALAALEFAQEHAGESRLTFALSVHNCYNNRQILDGLQVFDFMGEDIKSMMYPNELPEWEK